VLCLRGELVVIGKQPDGDSIRFVPDTPALLERLEHAERVRRSSDGSVQLRVEGIDAPETHYNTFAQPLGDPARDRLLALCGFTDVQHGTGTQAETVTDATPPRIAAAILSHIVDVNGRPVSFLLVGDGLPPDGADVPIDDALLLRTLNARQLLPDWLRAHGPTEDDELSVSGGPLVHLSDLVEQDGDEIAFTAALLDLVFEEK
jgi:hypothetical protein